MQTGRSDGTTPHQRPALAPAPHVTRSPAFIEQLVHLVIDAVEPNMTTRACESLDALVLAPFTYAGCHPSCTAPPATWRT